MDLKMVLALVLNMYSKTKNKYWLYTIFQNFLTDALLNKEYKSKLFFRVMLNLHYEKALQLFFEQLEIEYILTKHPRFYNKFSRPLIKKNISKKQKLNYIKNHYQFLTDNFSKNVIYNFYHDGITLFDFSQHQIDLQLNICYDLRREREGELMLNLKQRDNTILYTISFTLGEKSLYIGGIQGFNGKEKIKQYTKALYGMRPQNLILFTLLKFSSLLKITQVYALSSESQIYANDWHTKKNVSFQYANFYKDIFGNDTIYEDNWFHLPNTYPLKSVEELKSKKRSMYKKRYLLLDDISESINSFIQKNQISSQFIKPS